MNPPSLKWSRLRTLNKPDREKAIKALRKFKPGYGHNSAEFAIDSNGRVWAKNPIAGVGPVEIDTITWRVKQNDAQKQKPAPKKRGRKPKAAKP